MANQQVEYACDSNGDHTALMADCTDSNVISFDNESEKLNFIAECTHVYNLNEALGNEKRVPNPNPVINSIANQRV